MRIDLISAVPDLLRSPLDHSIVKRARDGGYLEVNVHNLRDYTYDRHQKVDDTSYGGGAGMVMQAPPIFECIESLQRERTYDRVIFTSPDGKPFKQEDANRLSMEENLLILCGHYKGVDQRVRDVLITDEYSIGDYVLSGGELPALVIVDAIARLIPGVLGDAESALEDSFMDGLLGYPVYSRPEEYRGLRVPDVLTSGHHKKIKEWRFQQSLERTRERRPDLYQSFVTEQHNPGRSHE
jgi:tRNA (guanine37-N1)-methyltransferase